MTETAGPTTAPVPPPPAADHRHEPNRLNQVLAWVGIVAGVVFIVAIVFFSGFFLGVHSGGHGMWGHHKGMHMFHHRGQGPMGPGGQMPGGPGGQMPPGPGGPTTLPSPSPAPRP